jgi:hypothetical protein
MGDTMSSKGGEYSRSSLRLLPEDQAMFRPTSHLTCLIWGAMLKLQYAQAVTERVGELERHREAGCGATGPQRPAENRS